MAKMKGPGAYGIHKKRRITKDIPKRDPDQTPVNLHTFDLALEKLAQLSREGKLAAIVLIGIPKEGDSIGGARVIDSEEGLNELMRKIDEASEMIKEGHSLGDEFSFVFDK